ncbi:Uncharacterized protein C8034_v002314 [Colletotrichum sidae]|uniref:Hydantoinase B/oxoprolinase domain-containing protein n=1 Tax=Colletotrichum sidae TaxID=1347389 RepID=A0A4R8TD36_9PEZI|nr:Uncharacterized protein C8034_v002314 [Colletotrichum sidae]
MYSGIIYCMRSLISADIPLNQGSLAPIKIHCPPNTILSPSLKAATVGSNVETPSAPPPQARAPATNLTFGRGGTDGKGEVTKGSGYFETIAGGSGAGPSWDGQSGVHTNVTNTRITDPEVPEKRYPVLLREFSIRRGSGGQGRRRGGDGCIRDIEFRRPMQVSILSERRGIAPYGMAGGGEG